MDTPAIEISLDGTKIKADDGEWLVYKLQQLHDTGRWMYSAAHAACQLG
jgi:hypothetical protein